MGCCQLNNNNKKQNKINFIKEVQNLKKRNINYKLFKTSFIPNKDNLPFYKESKKIFINNLNKKIEDLNKSILSKLNDANKDKSNNTNNIINTLTVDNKETNVAKSSSSKSIKINVSFYK